MKLYLVRHGQTDWNTRHLVQGSSDNALNAEGIRQAEELRDRIAGIQFDICFSSPLARAYRTAEIITNGRCRIVTSPLLAERYFGEYEGVVPSEDWMKYWTFSEGDKGDGGMETLTSSFERAGKFIEIIKKNFPNDSKILVVSHGGILKVIHYVITGYDENTDLTQVHFENCDIRQYDI